MGRFLSTAKSTRDGSAARLHRWPRVAVPYRTNPRRDARLHTFAALNGPSFDSGRFVWYRDRDPGSSVRDVADVGVTSSSSCSPCCLASTGPTAEGHVRH